MAYWKTKEFLSLAAEWQRKLEESGFVDEEKIVGQENKLHQYSSNLYRNGGHFFLSSQADFFNLIYQMVSADPYMRMRDRIIMREYAAGKKQREILEILETRGFSCNRITITRVKTRFFMKWKIPMRKQRKIY